MRRSPGPVRSMIVWWLVVVLAAGCSSVEPATVDDDRDVDDVPTTASSAEAEVARLIDGDSLELVVGREELEVRLAGINAPELTTIDEADSCNGRAARDHLRGLLDGATSIEFVAGDEDRFGRRLGDLLVDGRSVNRAMVDSGWALALWSGEQPELIESMVAAAETRRGIWGDRCGAPRSGDLAIVGWQMDPPGDDRVNVADEWVVVGNEGDAAVDLHGWTIRDETTTNRFRIAGYTLDAGDHVRFRSGSGTAGDGDYYLGSEFPVWSNRGETVLLLDPEGRVASWVFVSG